MAPERDVVRVLEIDGPRGGKLWAHVLECGCTHTCGGVQPKKRVRCVACLVRKELVGEETGVAPHDLVLVSDAVPRALRNVYSMARRQIERAEYDPQWHDIMRYCAEAGIAPTIIRTSKDLERTTPIEEGDDRA